MTHLPALALFNLLLISSATAVESPLSSGSPGMKDWPENAMAVPAMHTVARISFIMIKYLFFTHLARVLHDSHQPYLLSNFGSFIKIDLKKEAKHDRHTHKTFIYFC